MDERMEVELDLRDIFYYLKKKIVIILIVAILGGTLGFVFGTMSYVPQYTASGTVYLLTRYSESALMYSDFQISSQLAVDFKELLLSDRALDQVIQKVGLNASAAQLRSIITVETGEVTARTISIYVTDTDPQRAADIVNALIDEGSAAVVEVMTITEVTPVDYAKVPMVATASPAKKMLLLGSAAGALLAIALFVALRVLDDSLRTEDDVYRRLGISTLGMVPESKLLTEGKTRKKMFRGLRRWLKRRRK